MTHDDNDVEGLIEYLFHRLDILKSENAELTKRVVISQDLSPEINGSQSHSSNVAERINKTAATVAEMMMRTERPCLITHSLGKKVSAAIRSNDAEKLKELISQKPSLLTFKCLTSNDFFAMNALHYAACQGKPDMVQVLLEMGMDPLETDLLGKTALHIAASQENQNQERVIRVLLEAMPNAQPGQDAPQDACGVTPAGYAAKRMRSNRKEMMKILHKDGDPCISPIASKRRTATKDPGTGSRLIANSSQSESFERGVCCLPGLRVDNEDRVVDETGLGAKRDISLFAVFDGHGGSGASEFCSKHVVQYFSELIGMRTNFSLEELNNLLVRLVDRLESEMRNSSRFKLFSFETKDSNDKVVISTSAEDRSGTTAIIVVVTKSNIAFVNVGDSRGLLVSKGDIIFSTIDQKAPSEQNTSDEVKAFWQLELERIQRAGGYVENGRVYRSVTDKSNHLAMTRALGDFEFKQNSVVIPTPMVRIFARSAHQDQWVAIASDGVWDAMSNEQLRAKIQSINPHSHNLDDIARSIVTETMFESGDNTSLIIVRISPSEKVERKLIDDFVDLNLI